MPPVFGRWFLTNKKNNVPPHVKNSGLKPQSVFEFLSISKIKRFSMSKKCGFNFGHNHSIY